MAEPLKVLMMGGRRCGKTSALASLFDEMTNGKVKNYFTVTDRTILERKGFELQDSLNSKTLELQDMLEKNENNSNIFLVDKAPTNNFWTYKLHIQIPGTKRQMDIEFRDSAGEFFESSGVHAEETIKYIEECDVYVIIIDTPYLMAQTDETLKQQCNDAANLGTNRVRDIQEFLTHISDNDGADAKMVIFVPLKCEAWAKKNELHKVTARVKEVYSSCIQNLSAYNKMNISIIPMQTCGNIIFTEFRKAFRYKDAANEFDLNDLRQLDGTIRCCKIDEETIRLENGENRPYPFTEGDILNPDPEAIINGTNIIRPYSWYRITPGKCKYEPQNCDQLPLHILLFMLKKHIDMKTNVVPKKSFWGKLASKIVNIAKRVAGVFVDMNETELQDILANMKQQGIIKTRGEGIEVIKDL